MLGDLEKTIVRLSAYIVLLEEKNAELAKLAGAQKEEIKKLTAEKMKAEPKE